MRHQLATLSLALLTAAALAAAAAAPATAQQADPPPEYSRFSGSVALLNTQPLGNLETGPGIGVDASGAWALVPGRWLRVRGQLRGAIYGQESRRACLSETVGCLIEVDINTDYSSFYLGVGPELAIPLFGRAALVLDATAGFGSFSVTSSIRGVSDPDDEDLLTTDNFEDTFFAWSVGAELRIRVSPQASIALGTHYQHNGEASYVPEGGITVNADGTLNVGALTTDANQIAITLGIAFHPFVGWVERLEENGDEF